MTTSSPGQVRVRAATAVSLFVLLVGGLSHRWLDRTLKAADETSVALELPLSSVPLQLGSWRGVDIPMDKRVLDVAGTDDHVCRRYVDRTSGHVVDLYVAYAARPAKMLGHRPHVCYPAHGWTAVGSRQDQVDLEDGRSLDCLIHHFTRTQPTVKEEIVVLNYYVLQGRYTADWTDFWGPRWRVPNLSRNPHFYVAQVQVSGAFPDPSRLGQAEKIVKRFTAKVAPELDVLLPLARNANAG